MIIASVVNCDAIHVWIAIRKLPIESPLRAIDRIHDCAGAPVTSTRDQQVRPDITGRHFDDSPAASNDCITTITNYHRLAAFKPLITLAGNQHLPPDKAGIPLAAIGKAGVLNEIVALPGDYRRVLICVYHVVAIGQFERYQLISVGSPLREHLNGRMWRRRGDCTNMPRISAHVRPLNHIPACGNGQKQLLLLKREYATWCRAAASVFAVSGLPANIRPQRILRVRRLVAVLENHDFVRSSHSNLTDCPRIIALVNPRERLRPCSLLRTLRSQVNQRLIRRSPILIEGRRNNLRFLNPWARLGSNRFPPRPPAQLAHTQCREPLRNRGADTVQIDILPLFDGIGISPCRIGDQSREILCAPVVRQNRPRGRIRQMPSHNTQTTAPGVEHHVVTVASHGHVPKIDTGVKHNAAAIVEHGIVADPSRKTVAIRPFSTFKYVIAQTAVQEIVTAATQQAVVRTIARQTVVQRIPGADNRPAGQRQILQFLTEHIVDPGFYGIDPRIGGLRNNIPGMVDDIDIIPCAPRHAVIEQRPREAVIAVIANLVGAVREQAREIKRRTVIECDCREWQHSCANKRRIETERIAGV